MRVVGRFSLPSFVAGAVCASALVTIPAVAVVTANDRHPAAFDGTSPLLTVQPALFVLGRTIDAAGPTGPDDDFCEQYNRRVPVRLKWNATDFTSGVASFDIRHESSNSQPNIPDVLQTTATTTDLDSTNYDNTCGGGFGHVYTWITARDHRGFSATSARISTHVDVWDEDGIDWSDHTTDLTVSKTGAWESAYCSCDNHAKDIFSTTAGASVTYTVVVANRNLPTMGYLNSAPGRTFAVVAPTGPTQGAMRISVDGGTPRAVSTYATTITDRVIVWQKVLSGGTHTIRITNAGTAGHSRIDIDTLMLGPAWIG